MKMVTLVKILFLGYFPLRMHGGDDGTRNGSSPSGANPERVVYLADQDLDDVFELYLVGSSIKLNHPVERENFLAFRITPDKTAVLYRATRIFPFLTYHCHSPATCVR